MTATGTSPRWPVLVAIVAVLVHARALGNGFALDDVLLVENNPDIVSLARLPQLFVSPYWNVPGESYGLYRPLTVASFAINRALLGRGPMGFHLVNVLVHGAVVALAWFALRRAGTLFGTAFAGSVLFAVLPIHTEAVANVAGRAELLAALFVVAGWLAHRRAYAAPSVKGWGAGAALLYLGAMLSKESAILAPLLFFCDDALRGQGAAPRRASLWRGYGAALLAMVLMRAAALGSHQTAEGTIPLDNPAASAGTLPRLATAVWVQLKLALLCVWPRHLVSDYSFDAVPIARSFGDPRAIAGLAFVAALVAAGTWGWKRSRPIALAVLLWGIFFLPSANLLFATGTIMAERLAYLPSLGLCLAAGHFAAAVAWGRKAVIAGFGAIVLALSLRTDARVADWKDNLTLATSDVATMPASAKLQAGAGMFLAEAGRAAEAEDHLERAVAIYPDYAQMHYNLAVLLARRGAREEAVAHLRRAVALAPGNPRPRQLLDQLTR